MDHHYGHEISSGFCIKAHGGYHGGNNGGGGGGTGTKCGRWNPTTEQVKVLTDLFRSGLRTPSTDQIQKISYELSFYGKIESKNVFYWFQNHKARERQKRRRVFVDEHDRNNEIHHQHQDHSKVVSSMAKRFGEIYQNTEPDRVIETLQLFPVNSNHSSDQKLRLFSNDCKENLFGTTIETDHPTLDLRLSFL